MSNEIRITRSMQIANGNLNYQTPSKDTSFNVDMTSTFGPSPGAVTVTTGGVDVDLTKLPTQGGHCEMKNTDATNYVTYGIKAGGTFYPLGEIAAGRSYVLQLSRLILYGMTGTASVQTFHMQADTASCIIEVLAFGK